MNARENFLRLQAKYKTAVKLHKFAWRHISQFVFGIFWLQPLLLLSLFVRIHFALLSKLNAMSRSLTTDCTLPVMTLRRHKNRKTDICSLMRLDVCLKWGAWYANSNKNCRCSHLNLAGIVHSKVVKFTRTYRIDCVINW